MAQAGGAKALQRLVDEHYAALYRYAYRLSGSADAAGDLTQETFCKAHARFAQLRDLSRARSWLYSILRNAYLHRVRAQKHHRELPIEWARDVAGDGPGEYPEVEPERLQEVLNEMSEGFRTPLILFYFEDFSYRDIAEQMDLPMGTVMSRLARAKAFLRERLMAPGRPGGANGL